ncbi:hypothetical protein VPH35_089028 [Triticum aestivum]
MAEEPSAKRHHAETSGKRSNLVDINVPGEKREPKRLTEMLQHDKLFTFAGFSIESDKEKLKLSASVIHPFYKGMKNKINTQEDYKLWGTSELPEHLIEYAGVDAYGAYKSWFMIDYIIDGWEYAKERDAENFYDRPYCPFTG